MNAATMPGEPAVAAAAPFRVEDHWLDGRRGRLFVRSWTPAQASQPAPLILLHDSLGSVDLWRGLPQALCLASGRQIIAYDRLGFGQSDVHPDRLRLDFIASEADDDFSAVRAQLGIGRFAVFGHSVGGGMAVHCAARYPGDCVALITESAQAFVEERTRQGIEAARQLFTDPAQVERLAKYHGSKARWVLDAWIGSWLHPDFADWSLDAVLPQIRSPALIIHGADDEYGSPRHPQRIAARLGAAAELAILANTRHVPHREDEAAIVRRIADFLSTD
jgi:pimeloyl-ACP methyl ester carboxylesterase